MRKVKVGVNMLEELTTGKYRDSRVIFREYIQNSCDQIDEAVESCLIEPNEGHVEIWIDSANRYVSIEDNATGIKSTDFIDTLYNIGESNKTLGKHKGFRGIGHWCGIGYCKTLIFTSKAKGELVESIMTCDASQMRTMMDDHNARNAIYTLDEVLLATVTFSENKVKDKDKHYFKVELLGIRDVNNELCSVKQIKDYLSFVAPVGYATTFLRFRNTIHRHAEGVLQPIQEYNVSVNDEPIKKKYTPSFTTSKGEDTITDIDFKDFKDDKGNLIAWLWFGISRFQGVLEQENQMRGIRLRTQNIQIGSDDALQKLFKEDRGQHYFVGEVFAISRELIPNSQRDYFNENKARLEFEHLLSEFFNDDLSRIYKAGSAINSKYDKIQKAEKIEAEIITAQSSGSSVTEDQLGKLERARKEAENATQELAKIRGRIASKTDKDSIGTYDVVVSEIIKRNDEERASRPNPQQVKPVVLVKPHPDPLPAPKTLTPPQKGTTDKLVSLNRIRQIIRDLADSSVADTLIAKIEEEC